MSDNAGRDLANRRWALHPPVERSYVCAWCGQPFTARAPAKYCRASHRQMASVARKKEKN